MGTIIVVAIIVVIAFFAARSSFKHFKGEGGCCGGGGGSIIEEEKKLDGPKLGEVTVKIEGMHCENCKNRVERAINRIEGASAKVNLKKKVAVVSYDREISDDDLKRVIAEQEYKIIGIER